MRLGVAMEGLLMRTMILLVPALVLVSFATWEGPGAEKAATNAALGIPQEIVALAQDTRAGGQFMLEVDAAGKVIAYSAEIDVAQVPAACKDAIEKAAPGGKVVSAEKEIIGGTTYFEIEKEIGGLRVEVLATPEGKVAGSERVIRDKDVPAAVLSAANVLVPEGEVVAVERVEGPESLGAPEHHVKKKISGGEVIRIRVTEKGAVEVLRKLKSELKVPRKK